jgi:adenylate cyclase
MPMVTSCACPTDWIGPERAPVPPDEFDRLADVRALGIIGDCCEERFDRITRLASRLFEAPIAYVSIIEENRQWFKSQVGFTQREAPREFSFCGHAIMADDTMVVPDALQDQRFARNPNVAGEPYLRFYIGHPLRGPGGHKVGTLCLMDQKPRDFAPSQVELFRELAALVERELNLTEMIGYQQEILRTKEALIESQRDLARLYEELGVEKQKTDDLLRNILPDPVADELKQHGRVDAVSYDCASVMFTDFVDFTHASEQLSPQQLVDELHVCFSQFDRIIAQYGVEKLKTIGDGYMCVSGIPNAGENHASQLVTAALAIRDWMRAHQAERELAGLPAWNIRIGINSGPVVAGVVGLDKFAYDIWGDTVNIASRLETGSLPGQVNISRTTHDLIAGQFECQPRGIINVRNRTELEMFFVHRKLDGAAQRHR